MFCKFANYTYIISASAIYLILKSYAKYTIDTVTDYTGYCQTIFPVGEIDLKSCTLGISTKLQGWTRSWSVVHTRTTIKTNVHYAKITRQSTNITSSFNYEISALTNIPHSTKNIQSNGRWAK